MPRRNALLLASGLLLGLAALAALREPAPATVAPRPPAATRPPAGITTQPAAGFDHYVMALSWSPSFCHANPDEREQCTRAFGFVLHGLWPQYANGRGGPESCAAQSRPDADTIEAALAFMPSRSLVRHQWRKHGTCSGLAPAAYFERSAQAFASFHPPAALQAPRRSQTMDAAALRRTLEQANPGLQADMLSLHCRRGELTEVRICVDRDTLAPRSCGERTRDRCPTRSPLLIRAVD